MKNISQKLYIGIGTALTLVFVFIGMNQSIPQVQAQCTPGASGNLYGYLEMSNIESPNNNRIYLSTESWNDNEAQLSNEPFAVTYNAGSFDGRGWSPVIGWVDFGGNDTALSFAQQARFMAIPLPDGGQENEWGSWNPIIDLSNVNYSTDPGGFVGLGTNGFAPDTYNTGDTNTTLDTPVGVGYIDFSNVDLDENSGCNEDVFVFVNGSTSFWQENCPIIEPTISWTSNNIVSGTCEIYEGAWEDPIGTPIGDAGALPGLNVTSSMSPELYRVLCESSSSPGDYITSAYASASCGGTPPDGPGNPGGENIFIPQYTEV